MNNKIRIAIAEDSKFYLDGVVSAIEQDPTLEIVKTVDNGLDAIEVARELQPDVFLMDIGMPGGMNGIEATKRIRRINPSIKILVVSMHDDNVYPVIRAGASGFLHKDKWNSDEGLLQAIHTIADGGVVFNSDIASKILREFSNPVSDLPRASLDIEELTEREQEILDIMITEGITTNGSIAQRLEQKNPDRSIAHSTVARHLTNIQVKLSSVDRAQLMWRTLKSVQHVVDERKLAQFVMLACQPPRASLGRRKKWTPETLLAQACVDGIFDTELADEILHFVSNTTEV